MTTKYPSAIDGYKEIRIVNNNIEEVVGEDHNDLRSAIVAIEQTLGISPQGSFGTVVARLNDAYNNIEHHVLGNPPRHMDSVIMSPERLGSTPSSFETLPYNLSTGTLASQIISILEFLNDAVMYDGSGSTTFGDGTSIPVSSVRAAITEIINQLGGTDGSDKIGISQLDTGGPWGVSGPPTNTSLKDQLSALLSLINEFGKYTGAARVGTTNFTTQTGGRYVFSDGYVQDILEELGNNLDEAAGFREKIFNAFVVTGCYVTNSSGNALVSSGYIAANGRVRPFAGGTVSIPDGSTSYVYAETSGGTVSVTSSTSIPIRISNPIVLLHKITRSGTSWTVDVDIRRFGLFVNDKNYISVGNKPTSGQDGLGCDFISLKSAVEYAKIINNGDELLPPLKIILASDLTISSSSEMEILLNVEGMCIDGCGRKIVTNQDKALFKIEQDNVTIKDLVLESNLSSSGSYLCLAHIGNTTNINAAIITNCILQKTGSYPATFFIRLGNSGATTSVSKSVFSENIVEVEKGGIEYVSTSKYVQVLKDSVVIGNNIYQGSFLSTSYAGIKASQHCTVGDNIIKGGFDTGILLTIPLQCRVDGNLVIGFQSASIYMNNGIAIWNNAAGQDNGCVISDNTIKGINLYGINCRAGSGSGAFIAVYGNFIDNYFSVGTPPSGMIAIKGRGSETWVVGNKITAPGTYAIENCSHAISNQIYGYTSITGTSAAIEMASGTSGVVENNTIINVSGAGININSCEYVVVSGNSIIGNSNSGIGIYLIGAGCIVSNNLIKDYTTGGISTPSATNYDDITITDNKILDCSGFGIKLNASSKTIISGNWLICPLSGGSVAISEFAGQSIISNNYIANYGAGGGHGRALKSASGSYYDILISGNLINNLNVATESVIYIDITARVNVVGNVIDNCPGVGITFYYTKQAMCSNNIISGDSISTYAIYDVREDSIICGNIIDTYNQQGISLNLANNSIVSNNTINGTGDDGINLYDSDYVIVANNSISNTGDDGIELGISNYTSVIGNNLYQCDYGVYINGSTYVSVVGNSFTSTYHEDIYNALGACLISGNSFYSGAKQAIYNSGSNCNITNNYIYGNQSLPSIYCSATAEMCSITGNYISDPSGNAIVVEATKSLISSNYINNSGDTAITLTATAPGSIVSNNFINICPSTGIFVDGSDNVVISGNIIVDYSGVAIDILSSENVTIIGNRGFNPLGLDIKGIAVAFTDYVLVVGNSMEANGTGEAYLFSSSSYQLVSSNVASSGASLSNFTSPSVSGNYSENYQH